MYLQPYGGAAEAFHAVPVSAGQYPSHSAPSTHIEQPLTGSTLIKLTDLCPKHAKDFDLYLVEPFNQVVDLAVHGYTKAVNPFKQLEEPP
jgi:hypothetical protein